MMILRDIRSCRGVKSEARETECKFVNREP